MYCASVKLLVAPGHLVKASQSPRNRSRFAVVASEVLYWPSLTFFDEDTLEPLVATLLALCAGGEWRCPALIAYKQREAEREARFVALSRAAGFDVRELCLTPPVLTACGDGDDAAVFADPDPPDGPGLDAVRCLALEWRPRAPPGVSIPPD